MLMPMWLAILLAVFVSCIGMVAFRNGADEGAAGAIWRLILVVVGGVLTWLAFGPTFLQQSSADRARPAVAAAAAIPALPRAPDSSCLDAISDVDTEAACKRLLFAGPEAVMAAVAHTQSRLSSLAEGVNLARADRTFEPALEALRRAVEADPFGLVAQVLTMQGCGADCDTLKMLRDPQRILDNIRARTFETIVAEQSAQWGVTGSTAPAASVPAASAPVASSPGAARSAAPPVAESTVPMTNSRAPVAAAPPAAPAPQGSESLASRFSAVGGNPNEDLPSVSTTGSSSRVPFEYPSAASIPPVSIMNPEPATQSAPVERRSTGSRASPANPQTRSGSSTRSAQ